MRVNNQNSRQSGIFQSLEVYFTQPYLYIYTLHVSTYLIFFSIKYYIIWLVFLVNFKIIFIFIIG